MFAQWPGFLGLFLFGLGALLLWYVHTYGGLISFKVVALLFGLGLASMSYWSLANRNDDYNF
jgi:hypothetical protein